jgi:hypothetical protein
MLYSEWISDRRRIMDNFDDSDLSTQFIPYFESGQRIKVNFGGFELTGRVGVTTGRKPAFLLMRTSRSYGSPWVLSDKDSIVAVKIGRSYRSLSC